MLSSDGLAVCDAHNHLWDRPDHHPDQRFMVPEFRATIDAAGVNVIESVFVECGVGYWTSGPAHLRPVGETEYIANSDADRFVAGILGRADLTSPALHEVIQAHKEVGQGRFRGVRQVVAWDADPAVPVSHFAPPPHLLLDDSFRAGAQHLAREHLSLDVWLFHSQIPELIDFARSIPDLAIVVDHLGGPLGIGSFQGKRDLVMSTWRAAMRELSKCPNVRLKLGGFGMPVFGMGWLGQQDEVTAEHIVDAWGEHIRWCIEQFSAQRCMFESNFPVDGVSVRYGELWRAFEIMTADGSKTERQRLFRDTALDTYGIESPRMARHA